MQEGNWDKCKKSNKPPTKWLTGISTSSKLYWGPYLRTGHELVCLYVFNVWVMTMGIDKVSIHSSPLGFSSHELTSTPEILMFWGGKQGDGLWYWFSVKCSKKRYKISSSGPLVSFSIHPSGSHSLAIHAVVMLHLLILLNPPQHLLSRSTTFNNINNALKARQLNV